MRRTYRIRFHGLASPTQEIVVEAISYAQFVRRLDHFARAVRRMGFEVIGWDVVV
jgi:alpha-beta hydrolase superfamily lysophospholipase